MVNRYHRQMLLPQVGEAGQERLARARVLLVGCGALGAVMADQLARAGVGWLRIADRDVVEWTNLQRQTLFDEEDARRGIPKAIAAADRLGKINSNVVIEPMAVDVHSGNIEELIGSSSIDLILDGTDNAEIRYLINDAAVKLGLPWVYGACVGVEGRVMVVQPGKTACLRCVFEQPPGAGELATCDTVGVLGSAAGMVASMQAAAGIRLLVEGGAPEGKLVSFDAWSMRFRSLSLAEARRGDCVCCAEHRFDFLDRPVGDTVTLCGRDAVQVRAERRTTVDLEQLRQRLAAVGEVESGRFFLRCRLHPPEEMVLTVFPDGRLIVQGVTDPARARSVYSRFIGI